MIVKNGANKIKPATYTIVGGAGKKREISGNFPKELFVFFPSDDNKNRDKDVKATAMTEVTQRGDGSCRQAPLKNPPMGFGFGKLGKR